MVTPHSAALPDSSVPVPETAVSTSSVSVSSVAPRVVLAKVGLDGHDRGIKVIARGLRDAGFHVIYAGIWQSPAAVAQAVVDEDADWLGISLLSGAHREQMAQVVAALRAQGRGDVGIVLGGIIPPQDVPTLQELGISLCYGPGTRVDSIAEDLRSHMPMRSTSLPKALDDLKSDRVAQARVLSRIAQGLDLEAVEHVLGPPDCPLTATDRVLGITGSPGVGKSSLISRLIPELRRQGQTVAVLSCDPQSPVTGGALLGDRVRMNDGQSDPGVFIRSLASPSGSQGVAPHLKQMIHALRQFGYDWVLVETVGTGQGDVRIREVVPRVALLIQPETGDALQWEKAGVLEFADILVITKGDLPGADRLRAELAGQPLDGAARPIVVVHPHEPESIDLLRRTIQPPAGQD